MTVVLLSVIAAGAAATPGVTSWPGAPGNLVVVPLTPAGVWEMSLSGTLGRKITDPGYVRAVRAAPDGRSFLILTSGRDIDGDVAAYLLERGRSTKVVQHALEPAWTPDGKGFAFVAYETRDVCSFLPGVIYLRARVRDRASQRVLVRSSGCGNDASPTFSPNGTKMAWEHAPGGGSRSIRVLDLATRTSKRLTAGEAPSWSPNGKLLAFWRDGSLLTIELGSGRVTRIAPTKELTYHLAWAPDSRSLAYNQTIDYRTSLVIVDIATKKSRRIKTQTWVMDWLVKR